MEQYRFIKQHNQRFLEGKETYFVDFNHLSDLSEEEYNARNNYVENHDEHSLGSTFTCTHVYRPSDKPETNCEECHDISTDATNEVAFYWQNETLNNQNKVLVTNVKDQGACGSCWAFAGAATLEGQFCANDLYDCNTWNGISAQEYVDCNLCDEAGENDLTGQVCAFGCGGGWSQNTWYYVKAQGGTNSWDDYPYESGTTGKEYECRYSKKKNIFPSGRQIEDDCVTVSQKNEIHMMQAVNKYGPIKVSINAGNMGFRLYAGGVYSDDRCGQSTNHAVTVTGYGILDGVEYWMVKNSWGTGYGESGYIKMRRNYNNMCSIGTYPYWPLI